jgi:hypothetical protein
MAVITVCDICDSRDNIKHYSFNVDRRMDAAGFMDDVIEFSDLCEHCALNIYCLTLTNISHENNIDKFAVNNELVKTIKRITKEKRTT